MSRLLFIIIFVFQFSFATHGMGFESTDSLLVAEIAVSGNKRTKSSIILRELTFKKGDILTKAVLINSLERSRQNIVNTDLFVSVNLSSEQKGDSLKIKIEVQEQLYLLPLPIIYLADRSFNEWWYNRNHDFKRVVLGFQVKHSNLTGNADVLKVKAYGGFIPYFEVSYGRPYIDKRQRMGLRGGVFYSTQKSFAYRTWNDKLDFVETENRSKERKGAFMEYSLRNGLNHFHTVHLGYTQTSISDTIASLNPDYLGEGRQELAYFTLKYDYRFDQRDNRQYPLDGQLLRFNLSQYAASGFGQLSTDASYHRYITLKNKFYWDYSLSGKLSFPKDQLYPFISALGYKNILVRGYELNVIDGQQYLLGQGNLKYRVFNKSFDLKKITKLKQFNSVPVAVYARLYADAGYVKNYFPERSNSSLTNRLLYGGGLGFDLVTFYNTSMKINFSVNQFGRGKVFFGIYRGG